jgi:hypothetical protein
MPEDFDTSDWEWTHSDHSSSALGDSGPWVWWVPLLWSWIADPMRDRNYPPRPEPQGIGHRASHAYRIAWWSPLFHLAFFALGWPHPERGIAAALAVPDDDPRLSVLRGWWGKDCDQILAWFQRSESYPNMLAEVSQRLGFGPTSPLPDNTYSVVRTTPEYLAAWPTSDPLHLDHGLSPVWSTARGGSASLTRSAIGPNCTLVLEAYAGWYRTLSEIGGALEPYPDGRSWRIDVVVKPIGWLGTFRQSRVSHRWFSGPHRWHQLGLDN